MKLVNSDVLLCGKAIWVKNIVVLYHVVLYTHMYVEVIHIFLKLSCFLMLWELIKSSLLNLIKLERNNLFYVFSNTLNIVYGNLYICK